MNGPVTEPWAGDVRRAEMALGRFDHAVGSAPPGPRQDRLGELRSAVVAAIGRCREVAAEGERLSRSLADLGPDRVVAEVKAARRAAADGGADPVLAEALAARASAAEAQYRVVHRLWDGVDGARARLAADLARLDELVARATELAVLGTGTVAATDPLPGAGLGDAIDDLEGLRLAFEELERPAPSTGSVGVPADSAKADPTSTAPGAADGTWTAGTAPDTETVPAAGPSDPSPAGRGDDLGHRPGS